MNNVVLKATVIKALRFQFGKTVSIDSESRKFAIFPAKHPSVGNVIVEEDGPELNVSIGSITHGHFGSYEEALSEGEHAKVIAHDLVDFLLDLFADKYVLYKASGGGGWTHIDWVKESDLNSPDIESFNWSGPIHRS
jgi:hypothetical protein